MAGIRALLINYQIRSLLRMFGKSTSHFQPVKIASRQPPQPSRGLACNATGQFLKKEAVFSNQISLKISSDKREMLLFFTIIL
jgi:hypothetical protein